MTLAAGQINNINDRFTTGVVTVSQEQVTEYQHTGSPTAGTPRTMACLSTATPPTVCAI